MWDLIAHMEEAERKRSERYCYAYELAYPESMGGAVFYVGKGTGSRIDRHEDEARRGVQSRKCDIIRQIWAKGGQVVKRKVSEGLTNQEALDLESRMIAHYGYEVLVNVPPQPVTPQVEGVVPVNICLYKAFRQEIEEALITRMKGEGIEVSSSSCYQYLQDVCLCAIREHLA